MKIPANIRAVEPRDLNHLLDIDLKCFDYCWGAEDWRLIASAHEVQVLIAIWCGTPLGFVVTEPQGKDDTKHLWMPKLAVKPTYRQKGIGTLLLSKAWERAVHLGLLKIIITVSETMCDPNRSFNSATWLTKMQFKGVGVVQQFVKLYGQYEDGYKFELEVRNEHSS